MKVDLSPLQLSNPPGGTPFSAITVATSADTVPAGVGTVGQFTVPQPVNNLNFSPSSTAGGATGVTWNVSFITSQYGAISGAGGVDNVTITAPTGTVFPNDRNQYRLSPCPSPPNVTVTGSKVVVHVDCPIAAASDLTVQIADVTNPSPGTLFSGLSVSTQTDPIAVSDTSGSAFTTPQTVSSVHFTASTLGANATGTVWQWRFTASSTGWLTHSYIYAFDPRGQITLTGPPGTTFSTDPNAYTVTDLTTGATGAGSPSARTPSVRRRRRSTCRTAGTSIRPTRSR